MSYIFEPGSRVTLPVVDSDDFFPVSQIYCVGRNYADHAIEMGHDPNREDPFFFLKPAYSILNDGKEMTYPSRSHDVHHEVELVVALSKGGRNIDVNDAMDLVYGYAVGIDMTRRDLQAEAKEKSRPWEAGKTFLHAAPCSAVVPMTKSGEINYGSIQLSINGSERQRGDINQMIWKVPEVISRLSELFVLHPGDLIYTGTPAGVGPVNIGDRIEAAIENVGTLNITVAEDA
jgi:fumarylpyruvate hydrolase